MLPYVYLSNVILNLIFIVGQDYLGKKPEAFKSFSSLMINSAEITVGISEADLTTFEKISHEHISVSTLDIIYWTRNFQILTMQYDKLSLVNYL